jgi:serine/threonine protein kinase
MGEVYRASDPRLQREVALKLILEPFASDASRVHRFEQEARAASQLNHPNILALGTFDIAPDGTAIVFDRLQESSDIVLIELPK